MYNKLYLLHFTAIEELDVREYTVFTYDAHAPRPHVLDGRVSG